MRIVGTSCFLLFAWGRVCENRPFLGRAAFIPLLGGGHEKIGLFRSGYFIRPLCVTFGILYQAPSFASSSLTAKHYFVGIDNVWMCYSQRIIGGNDSLTAHSARYMLSSICIARVPSFPTSILCVLRKQLHCLMVYGTDVLFILVRRFGQSTSAVLIQVDVSGWLSICIWYTISYILYTYNVYIIHD